MNKATAKKANRVKQNKPKTPTEYAVPAGYVLILRTCGKDMTSYNGFKWPNSGPVSAPDWKPVDECGNGLHGFLKGEGDGVLASKSIDAVWLVAEVEEKTIVDLVGKVKFPLANVIYSGSKLEATSIIQRHYPTSVVIGGTATAGYSGTATAGYSGTATAGDSGTATAGDSGTATAGYSGTATAGDRGTATAGDRGTIVIKRWDGVRYRLVFGYIGEGDLLPKIQYKLDCSGNFIKAT